MFFRRVLTPLCFGGFGLVLSNKMMLVLYLCMYSCLYAYLVMVLCLNTGVDKILFLWFQSRSEEELSELQGCFAHRFYTLFITFVFAHFCYAYC